MRFRSVDYHSRQIEKLEERYKWFRARPSSLSRGLNLLEDCRRYGTLPFAHLARFGFVAVSLLRSARARRLILEGEDQAFMQSLKTVTRQLGHDSRACSRGELPWEEFVTQYGHLRPGTYDMVSPTYAENAERFLRPLVERTARLPEPHRTAAFTWDPGSAARLERELKALGLPLDIAAFDAFLRCAIEGREYSKFIFSRNLSMALDDFHQFGEAHGLSREQVSYLDLSHLQSFSHGQAPCENGRWLKRQSEEGRQLHEAMQALEMPHLIVTEDDLDGFVRSASAPNFIGTGRILGHIADLAVDGAQRNLDGRIALVPQADPGYDWLFGQGISGLITEYGGANSHMAIRSAEFGLPAAIGVGELLYERLQHATVVELDCDQCQIHTVQ
jgi:phosphohistidine swiveling domain-containing protein